MGCSAYARYSNKPIMGANNIKPASNVPPEMSNDVVIRDFALNPEANDVKNNIAIETPKNIPLVCGDIGKKPLVP